MGIRGGRGVGVRLNQRLRGRVNWGMSLCVWVTATSILPSCKIVALHLPFTTKLIQWGARNRQFCFQENLFLFGSSRAFYIPLIEHTLLLTEESGIVSKIHVCLNRQGKHLGKLASQFASKYFENKMRKVSDKIIWKLQRMKRVSKVKFGTVFRRGHQSWMSNFQRFLPHRIPHWLAVKLLERSGLTFMKHVRSAWSFSLSMKVLSFRESPLVLGRRLRKQYTGYVPISQSMIFTTFQWKKKTYFSFFGILDFGIQASNILKCKFLLSHKLTDRI